MAISILSTIATTARKMWTRPFRVDGKAPELWDAASGAIAAGGIFHRRWADDRSAASRSVRNRRSLSSASQPRQLAHPARAGMESAVAELDDALNKDWTVSFEPNRGAPETAQFDRLISWSEIGGSGREVFLRLGHLLEDHRSSRQRASRRERILARSGRRGEYRGGRRQRQVSGHFVEDAVPGSM